MDMSKADFIADHDVFVAYDLEEVMCRWDCRRKKSYRKFRNEAEEREVPHDSKLFNDVVLFGRAITEDEPFVGRFA